jgi:hypothetical protein
MSMLARPQMRYSPATPCASCRTSGRHLPWTGSPGCCDPAGVLRLHDLIFDFQPNQAGAVLDAWLEDAAEDASLGYTRDDFAEHLRTEFSAFRWLFEPMLTSAALDIVTAAFDGQIYGAYTCIKA